MLFTRGGLRIGETVLVNSVGSGIGSAAMQLAKLAGAYVIGNVELGREARAGRASSAWTSASTTRRRTSSSAVMEITDGRGVDLVYEHVGGELFQKGSSRSARTAGSSPAAAHAGEVVPFDIIPFFRAPAHASSARSSTRATSSRRCSSFAARRLLQPLVASSFPLDDAQAAMERMESREFFGKIVLRREGAGPAHTDAGAGMKRVGVDVGGTFTDLIYVDDEAGKVLVHKTAVDAGRSVAGNGPGHHASSARRPASSPRSSTRSSTGRRSRRTS